MDVASVRERIARLPFLAELQGQVGRTGITVVLAVALLSGLTVSAWGDVHALGRLSAADGTEGMSSYRVPAASLGIAYGLSAPAEGIAEAEEAQAATAAADRPVDHIEELLQYPTLPAGCESVALTGVLRSLGFEPGLTEIVDSYLAIDPFGGDFVHHFFGNPYVSGGALPPAIVNAANAYLASQGEGAAGMQAVDISGSSFDALLAHVEAGDPVLVWTTVGMGEPSFFGPVVDGRQWYTDEHCVVLYGVEGSQVLVSDPIDGLVQRDAAEFQRIYETCGSMAAYIAVDGSSSEA